MGKTVGLIQTDQYSRYNLGTDHPLNPLRIELTYSLMRAYGLIDNPNLTLINPRIATDKEVLRVHKKSYLDKLKEINSLADPENLMIPEYGLGPGDNPIFPQIYDVGMTVCGTSVSAAEYLLSNDQNSQVFNIVGGLHHAMPESASGFCILNDIAVMIQYILDKRPGSKVMYLDVDCHHGDGVQWIFYDRKDVLKLDFHQDGRTLFPGSGHINEIGKGAGKGYSLNVPLGEDTPDELYLDIFTRLVPQVMDAYQPDFLVMQCGVDTYFQDPLTRFGLSTSGHEQIFKNVLKWVPKYCKNKLIALGGGGYNISVVARSWTMYLAAMLNVELPNQLPEKWIREFKSKFPMDDPGKILRDSNFRIAEILDRNHYYLDELKTEQSIIIDKFEKELIPQIKSK